MENNTYTIEQVKKLATELARDIRPQDVLALYGDLGSGKTTFTNYLVQALGFKDRVQSPTFVLLRRYTETPESNENNIHVINHLDLYRLNDSGDLHELGLNEIVEEPATITIIEWPGIAENLLSKNTKKIFFEYIDEKTRKIKIHNKN